MARKPGERVARIVAEVEKSAKRLRGEVRKRVKAAPIPKGLQNAAERLRERAATAAGQVEKYVHQIRMELEDVRLTKPAPLRRKAARARRKRALTAGRRRAA